MSAVTHDLFAISSADAQVIVALFGVTTAIVTGGMAFMAVVARRLKASIGTPNGQGNVVQMAETVIDRLTDIQDDHSAQLTKILVSQEKLAGRIDLITLSFENYVERDMAEHKELGEKFSAGMAKMDTRLRDLRDSQIEEAKVNQLARHGHIDRRQHDDSGDQR